MALAAFALVFGVAVLIYTTRLNRETARMNAETMRRTALRLSVDSGERRGGPCVAIEYEVEPERPPPPPGKEVHRWP